MKKLNNPIFLETTHFQLSEDQAELLRLEMAEIKESAQPSSKAWNVRIRAIHAGTTRNLHTFALEELEKSTEKWTKPYGKPILKNHDIFEEPLGRIREADVIRFSDTDGVLEVVASVPGEDTVQKIYDQRYATVSVGVMTKNVQCSVCGTNWMKEDCDHTPGETYELEDTGEHKLCTYMIRDIEPVELSFVNLPADSNEERYAGVVHIGESEGIEFYADDDQGVGLKSKKKKSVPVTDNIALALKESWEEFLSLLKSEGEESQMNKEETTSQDTISAQFSTVEEPAEEELTSEASPEAEESESAEGASEEGDGGSVEDTQETNESPALDDSTIADLLDYGPESESQSEAESSDEKDSEPTSEEVLSELQSRVQELESENAELKATIVASEDESAKVVKFVRDKLSDHITDLRYVLTKVASKEFDNEDLASMKSKDMLDVLNKLRKELEDTELSHVAEIDNTGLLKKEALTGDQPQSVGGSNKSQSVEAKPLTNQMIVQGLTTLLSNRPNKGRS